MTTRTPAYLDPTRPAPARVADLLAQMTLPEKVGQMLQLDARGDLEDLVLTKLGGSLLHSSPERILEARKLVKRTRLQIPLLMADDAIHGHSFWPGATIFPTQLGMACTWDPELVERAARATAREIAATGLHWTFSPVLCVARDPRWGRVDETFGEDPHLIGELGVAMIRGYQGDGLGDRSAVLATAKHFAGYSETQGGRDASEADLSPRKLRSWFLPPFEKAAKAGCRTFMLGYQAIDGVPVTANRWLLHDVLKGEWGFQGTLVTDWDNVGRMVWEQHVVENDEAAAAIAVNAGNDLIMNTPEFFEAAQAGVESGSIDVGAIDEAVSRILTLKFDLGLFEDPREPDPARQAEVIGSTSHTALNLELARRSLVLLRNDGTLPLAAGRGASVQTIAVQTIAVIGPNADDPNAQLGDWAGSSGQVDWMGDGHPRELTATVLDGVRSLAPPGWRVTHARGADIGGAIPHPDGGTFPDGQPRYFFQAAPVDETQLADAVATAEAADCVILVLGDSVALTGEGRSTATLELQGGQLALLERLLECGTPVVIVLIHSKPAVLPETVTRAAAIIEAFNPGMQGGRAIAEIIFGLIEPSGRMPISVPRHAGQLPVFYNQIRGQHGDRYADLTQSPMFAFGEGLSYTNVDYSGVRLGHDELAVDGVQTVHVTLHNAGSRPALETVQVYVSDLVTSVTWAERELKAFAQAWLEPGERREVEIALPVAECSIVDAAGHRHVEPGIFAVLVGPSSRDRDLLGAEFRVLR